jgi:energy-coupling factor transporter transmembrane protein EcfT
MNGKLEIAVSIIYYMIALGATISFYTEEIKKEDMRSFVFYPVFMVLSPIPYETGIMLLIVIAIVKNSKQKLKNFIVTYWSASIFIGLIFIFLSTAFGSFGKDTIIASKYSEDRKHRVDVIDSDMGALGGDTYIQLYSIYFSIIQRYNRNIYHGGWGERPQIEWSDKENVNVNGNILNIKNSPMYENEK